MRPLRLTMQAFGPYAGREVVDFRAAVAHGLFGIYGPTGAGKSTIFSAMTFALFGEAARSEQEIASLRCDLADPATPTEVELVFELAGRTYVIRRRPDQMRPKQRGDGETRDPHEASLFDATGIALEAIGETSTGKPLAERKTGQVRTAVGDLLGYGAEQFRQIVLLPQGRFEAFLAAKTDERMKILRDLFDVSLYRRLSDRLKRDADAATRSVADERLVYERRLKEAGFDALDGLGTAIEAAAAGLAEEVVQERAAQEKATAALRAREAADRRAERFVRAEEAAAALKALEQRVGEIAAVEARLDGARRAQALRDVEAHFRLAGQDTNEAAARRSSAQGRVSETGRRAEAAATALAQARERQPEVARAEREVQALEAHAGTLARAGTLETAACETRQRLALAQREWEGISKTHAGLVEALGKAEAAVTAAHADANSRNRLGIRRTELEAAIKAADVFQRSRKAATDAQTEVGVCEKKHGEAVLKLEAAQHALDRVEADIAAALAVKLAADLVPDAPCPVCGSCSHPAPASGTMAHAGLNERRKDARRSRDTADEACRRAASALERARATWDERRSRLAELSEPPQAAAALADAQADVMRQIDALGPAHDADAADARCHSLRAQLTSAETKREAARNAQGEAREASVLAAGRLEEALSAVPEPLRDGPVLADALEAAMATLAALRKAREAAEAEDRDAREALIGARKDVEAAAETLQKAEARRAEAEAAFLARLAESGFTEAEYEAHKAAIATMAADQETVEAHRRALGSAQDAARQAAAAIEGEERPDVEAFRTAQAEAEALLRGATEKRVLKESEHVHLVKLRQSLVEAARKIEALEADSAPLRELARLFNARNSQNLDLETFAIGAMFGEVLRAANQRLRPMTAGRYTLEREVEPGAGRSRSGLGIRVFDTHTGKSRPTATLSGGETFIAALALALGLSDVVETSSGKVRLDTIFIDEGFGSLDAENESGTLEMVLDVLTDLAGRNRAIGLISHVPMVQEAIPNGFYIRQQASTGSRVEVRGTAA